jgi:hypothetical protein
VVNLALSKEAGGDLFYLLESPDKNPLRQGLVGGAGVSLVSVEAGGYYLTLSTESGELTEYAASMERNLLKESLSANDSPAEAIPVAYGWTDIGGCARLLTMSGQVGLGDARFDLEPNNSLEEAQSLEDAEWSLEMSSDILDSTIIPHTSMRGTGDGTKDIYRIECRVPGSRLVCDIDRSA